MGLYYLPFWTEIWWKDYKVQALPRNTRLIFYDVLFLLWDRDMQLANPRRHRLARIPRTTPQSGRQFNSPREHRGRVWQTADLLCEACA